MPRSDNRLVRRSFALGALLLATVAATGCVRQTADTPPRSVLFFDSNSANLDSASRGVIGEFVTDAKSVPNQSVIVAGYADTAGSPQASRMLSALRAKVVADELVAQGIAPGRITQRPRGTSGSDPGIESRRVELQLGR